MVLIGKSNRHERQFVDELAKPRNAQWAHATTLEAELARVLGREIRLPRDPQKVATFAPNVYIYYVVRNEFGVAAHLFESTPYSKPYNWSKGRYFSHVRSFFEQDDEDNPEGD